MTRKTQHCTHRSSPFWKTERCTYCVACATQFWIVRNALCTGAGIADRAGVRAILPPVGLIVLRCVGVASWEQEQASGDRCGQIAEGSYMNPKIFALWTIEFPSAISPSSRCRARRSTSWSRGRAATAAPPSAGYRARARHRAVPSASSLPTSCRGTNERRLRSMPRSSADRSAA